MATITLTIEQLASDLQQQAVAINKAFQSESLKKKIAILSVAGVKDHFAQGTSPSGQPWPPLVIRKGKPLRDTGRLAASTTARVTAQGVELHNAGVGANLHQHGGTVRPKKGKYLAIPLTAEARRAGSPRAMTDLVFLRKKGATSAVFVDKAGKAVFALVTSVMVPKREFLGWSVKTLDWVEKVIVDEIARAIGTG